MYCPECKGRTKVIDSRSVPDKNAVRRRRRCLDPGCGLRFTTYEDYGESQARTELESLRKKLRKANSLIGIAQSAIRKGES